MWDITWIFTHLKEVHANINKYRVTTHCMIIHHYLEILTKKLKELKWDAYYSVDVLAFQT